MQKRIEQWSKRIVLVANVVAAIFGVVVLTQWWVEEAKVASVEKYRDQLRQGALGATSSLPDDAKKDASGKLVASTPASPSAESTKQASTAADQFWRYFWVNTRMRFDYCKEQGVDISAFTQAFENLHRDDVKRASAISAREGADKEKIYSLLKSEHRKVIEDDMLGIARANNTDLREVCRSLAEHGLEAADAMQLAKVNPAIHQALVTDQ